MRTLLQRLYELLFVFKEYALLTLLVIVSLVLITLNDNAQIKHLRSVATVMLGLAQDRVSFIPGYIGLKSENATLRRINVELMDEAYQLREAKLENLRLRQLLELKGTIEYPLVAARVIGKDLTLLRNTLTLDVGTEDGVQPFMPVVNEAGLVGLVTTASGQYAVVNMLVNTDFRASAKVQRSRVDGIVAWDGRSMVLKNVAKTLDVKNGDVIITSEHSKTFPRGLRIGWVTGIQEQAGSLFKNVHLLPAVDFVRLEEVFVLQYIPSEERDLLEQRAGR